MSILIRDMEMPKSCDDCRFRDDAWCLALPRSEWRKAYNKAPEGERLEDCPLVEIPKSIASKIPLKTCLSCANSFSDDNDELHCMVQNERVVSDRDVCWEWTN